MKTVGLVGFVAMVVVAAALGFAAAVANYSPGPHTGPAITIPTSIKTTTLVACNPPTKDCP